MLTDRQIFLLIGFDTDAMDKYKEINSTAVLTPHLNGNLSSITRVGCSGRAKFKPAPLSDVADLVEKKACQKWAERQAEILKDSVSNAVLGG